MTESVKMWFDVTCPFAWMTAAWLQEVEKVRPVKVEYIPMSLAVLNDGRDLPESYAGMMEAAWGPARVFAKVKDEQPAKVEELYRTMGKAIHHDGQGGKEGPGAYEAVIVSALEQVGLDASFAEVADTDGADASLRAYHQQAMDLVGDEVGTPVVAFGDNAFFGPVITRLPTGEEAGELFDGVSKVAKFPAFFELKRTRTESPQLDQLV